MLVSSRATSAPMHGRSEHRDDVSKKLFFSSLNQLWNRLARVNVLVFCFFYFAIFSAAVRRVSDLRTNRDGGQRTAYDRIGERAKSGFFISNTPTNYCTSSGRGGAEKRLIFLLRHFQFTSVCLHLTRMARCSQLTRVRDWDFTCASAWKCGHNRPRKLLQNARIRDAAVTHAPSPTEPMDDVRCCNTFRYVKHRNVSPQLI